MKEQAKYLIAGQGAAQLTIVGKAKMGGDGSASDGWWVLNPGVKDITDPLFADDPFVKWFVEQLRSKGIDPKSSTQLGTGAGYGVAQSQALAIAGQLDGGLTRSNYMLAIRTIAGLDPSYDGRTLLNEALRDCARLAVKPVASALERNEHRAYYACGAVFALVAEKVNGNNFFSFTRGLITANQGDKSINSADWLAALVRTSGRPELGRTIAKLLDQGSPDPKDELDSLLREAGIPFTPDADGVPQLS